MALPKKGANWVPVEGQLNWPVGRRVGVVKTAAGVDSAEIAMLVVQMSKRARG